MRRARVGGVAGEGAGGEFDHLIDAGVALPVGAVEADAAPEFDAGGGEGEVERHGGEREAEREPHAPRPRGEEAEGEKEERVALGEDARGEGGAGEERAARRKRAGEVAR